MSDPAVAVVELDSIAAGIACGDAMVKAAPVAAIVSGSIQPGRYVILVRGDTASVEVALDTARAVAEASIVDWTFLPDAHPSVIEGLTDPELTASLRDEALGIVETASVARIVECADVGMKAADVALAAIVLGDGLGGHGYLLFAGVVSEVEAAQEAAVARGGDQLIRHELISQLHADMAANLAEELRFRPRMLSQGGR